ncbi:MAG: hypothetical protein M1812_006022 [Candelaria pacifica]|nr:MAG: hypothetical protein M1812_006022 [Candelaria pacifica]
MFTHGMSSVAFGLVAILASPASAFWRMPCPGTLVMERADPIVNPGAVSGHVHQIAGGSGFGFKMDYAQTQASSCSSCLIQKDMSNYWTPALYFQAANGSFESVKPAGGPTVYYQQRNGPNNDKLLAFPKDFRMLAGNPYSRSLEQTASDTAPGAVSYVCLDYGGGSSESDGFPTKNCPDGLRAQIYFPSCWNGELDSADHKSHMHYPIGHYDNGACPDTHPKHLISIFYEFTWQVDAFKDRWHGNTQPFVWAQGDPTGFGFHGDFVNGWDVDHLQQAVDTCTNNSGNIEDCHVFEKIPDSEANSCMIPPSVNEQISGVLDALPGCNPVTNGPATATPQSGCGAVNTIGQPESYFTDVTQTKKWEYVGCGSDNVGSRVLTPGYSASAKMTVETCIDYCSGKGYSFAGLEYSTQCYCGNSVAQQGLPIPGVLGNCQMKCGGDSGEYCGGGPGISLYKKCDGTCQNSQYGVVGNTTSSSTTPSSSPSPAANSKRARRHLRAHLNRES